ncbi:MAG: hypothetical protein ACAI35_20645 [Candidatus Methylacidiphilales bacterium]
MKPLSHPFALSRQKHSSGMALIITLSMIVLVSVATLAFFSMVTSDMKVESSRANRTKADLLAQSGSAHAMGQIINEITSPTFSVSTNFGDVTSYTPRYTTNAVPRRLISPALSLTDVGFVNLIRQSVPTADSAASTDATCVRAWDGRLVDTNRWSAPALLGTAGFTADSQLPNWVYVDGTAGATNTPSAKTIGRFAYNIYNIGGALNVNAAGYRDSIATDQMIYLKSSASGTDMTKLGAGITQADITKLTAFRNPDASTTDAYVDNIAGARHDGFLKTLSTSPESGDIFHQNLFSSRQDLLRYARTQNTAFKNITSSLTHFSRSLTAPNWRPITPAGSLIDYAAIADNPVSPNRNIPNVRFGSAGSFSHYDDSGEEITRSVKVGDPLIRQRFSLAKLGWLTPAGPSTEYFTNPGDGDAPIKSVFGLKWNVAAERWDYYGGETTAQSAIKTLAEVAAEATPREPNFFELLKAGILDGSVGSSLQPDGTDYASYYGSEDTRTVHKNKDLQLLRIGANIIDCADEDNYPTVIALNYSGLAMEVAGVEDLPYLQSVLMAGMREQDGTKTPVNLRLLSGDLVWVPVFYNPHRTSPATPVVGPAAVRFQAATGVITKVDYNGAGSVFPQPMTKDLTTLGTITIPKTAGGNSVYGFEDYRNAPKAALSNDATDPQRMDKLCNYVHPDTGLIVTNVDAAYANVKAFRIFSWQKEYTGSGKQTGTFNWFLKTPSSFLSNGIAYFFYPQQVNLVMRYQTPNGNWKTYATLGGNEAIPTSGMNGCKNDGVSSPTQTIRCGMHFNTGGLISHALLQVYYIYSFDPRTSRFGPVVNRFCDYGALPAMSYSTSGNSGAPPGLFPEAGKTAGIVSGSPTNFADVDGLIRPNDGWLGNTTNTIQTNPYRQTASATSLNVSHSSRPVLLQRPYQSVAELGYVFRDAPWKTLSFFDETSADSGLLDLFTVSEEPEITAGRYDLNAMLPPIKEGALSQTALDPYLGQSPFVPTLLSPATITTTASAYGSGTTAYAFSNGVPTSNVPNTLGNLVNFMSYNGLSTAGLDPVKFRREAVVRSLADVGQTRTWNVLIDVIAQTGTFPTAGAPAAGRFIVEGEQRYWWSVSIDRYTGKIIAQQLETVHE